jgi:hypothetical protein
MRMRVWMMVASAALLAAACGGSSGPSASERTQSAGATVTAEAGIARADALTAIAIQPSDLPGWTRGDDSYSAFGGIVTYTSAFSADGIQVSSTVAFAEPGATLDDDILRLREVQGRLMKSEQNYALDGADQAFVYDHPQAQASATLIRKEDYYVDVVVQSQDRARLDEVHDQQKLDGYTKIVFDRLQRYLADPSSVTPVPDTARYRPTAIAPAD